MKVKKILLLYNRMRVQQLATTLVLLTTFTYGFCQSLPKNHGIIQTKLFIGAGYNQPLVVAFGGSEGNNSFAGDHSKEIREKFLQRGYAFLAVSYFSSKGLPKLLDRISLDAVYDSIQIKSKDSRINSEKIVLLGGSRGAELVLNLAARYNNFYGVIALVPPNVTFPKVSKKGNNSSWTYRGEEVPYLNIPVSLVKQVGWLNAFKTKLEDEKEVIESAIAVEKINCPILLLSAKHDSVWPSVYMSDEIVKRLVANDFKYYYENISFDGDHTDASNHFDLVFSFVDNYLTKEYDKFK